jgi:hypothetical protein
MKVRFILPLAALALSLPAVATAETRRIAVVLGNNVGGPADKPLHYAEDDATKVADVLGQLGDVPVSNLFVLRGGSRADLQGALARVSALVTAYRKQPDDRTVLVFYYSGHSDGEALNLGPDRVSYQELKIWLVDTKADVRVAFIDGCKSGALVQSKGGTRAPAFDINLNDQLDASGDAIVSSSAADELALESREIRGSFFTHHLVSGLRGAADASGDGRITLAEAYRYAFDHTLAATSSTGTRQHPAYNFRISGKGELVLTEVTQPSAALELPEGFERALVVLVRRDQVIAEVTSDNARKVALAPGEYAVRVWKGTRAYAARFQTVAGEVKKVSWSDLIEVPSPAVASKGESDSETEEMSPEARLEYEQKYLTVVDGFEVFKGNSFKTYDVYQGKYRQPVRERDFFGIVGRPDYVDSYNTRTFIKGGLFVGGLALLVGGGVAAAVMASDSRPPSCDANDQTAFKACVEGNVHRSPPDYTVPIAVVVGGAALAFSSVFVNNHPVSAPEMRRLADEYNTALRRRLSEPPRADAQTSIRVEASPYAGRGGGGLVLRASF